MSRADARAYEAEKRRFKRKAGSALITALVPAGTPLRHDRYGVIFSRALQDWRRSPSSYCFCCQREGRPPGAMLFAAAAVRPTQASLSICCHECIKRPLEEVEAEAARVLRRVIADGRFAPLPDTS